MIFAKFAIAAFHKLYLLLNSTLVYVSMLMRTTKNMFFFIELISSPSEKVFTFAHWPLLQDLYAQIKTRSVTAVLTHIIVSIVSSFLPTSTVVSSANVMELFFRSLFQYLLPYHLILPSLQFIHCIDQTNKQIRYSLVLHLFGLGNTMLCLINLRLVY